MFRSLVIFAWIFRIHCSGSSSSVWNNVNSAFQNSEGIDRAVLVVGDVGGRAFSTTKGSDISSSTVLPTASLIKWITGAVVIKLYQEGVFQSLEDHPQKYVSWLNTSDARADVTLQQLLSFTSGFSGEPLGENAPQCIFEGDITVTDCAKEIHDGFFTFVPGTSYYYGPAHHQILGGIAETATGMSWEDLFETYVAGPLEMTNTAYLQPSATNPRLEGGAITAADDVEKFLLALLGGGTTEWGDGLLDLMAIDQTPTETVTFERNPFEQLPFHYGLSVWLECFESSWEECTEADPNHPSIISATGGLGFHAWIDRAQKHYGIIAWEGEPATATAIALSTALELRPLVDEALISTATPTTGSPKPAPHSTSTAAPLASIALGSLLVSLLVSFGWPKFN